MKLNKSLLLCLGTLLITTSCDKFLEENPKSSTTSASYITTEEQLISNTNYLYRVGAPLRYTNTGVYGGTSQMQGGYVSGYFDNQYAGQEVVAQYSKSLSRSSVNIADDMDGIWDSCYSAINVANQGLQDAPNIEGASDAVVSLYSAESKFFRAFAYYYLVKTWGDVPMTLTPSESIEGLEIPRTASSEVYAQIISDLTAAIPDLPSGSMYNNSRRITKNVAYAVLANVYLAMSGYPLLDDHYAEAAAAAEAIISSGTHSLTQHGENTKEDSAYNILRTTEGLAESIYPYEYNSTISSSGWWPAISLNSAAVGWGYFQYSITACNYVASNGLLNMYSDDDIRGQEKQFFAEYLTIPSGYDNAGTERELGFACNYYFFDETALYDTGIGTRDRELFRYAETLLVAAEALAKSGGSMSTARGYLAQVMARASKSKDQATIEDELASLSTDEFVEAVWAERLRELVLDFRIWDDICRTRQYPQFNESTPGTVTFVDVVGASNNWGQTFSESDLLWPLSTNELQRNPSLTQNPGYN